MNSDNLNNAASDTLGAAEVGSLMLGQGMFNEIHFEHTVSSTNDVAKKMAAEGAPEGTVVIAECQENGKGSKGRQWISPEGDNIYMSFILKPAIEPAKASMLTLIGAMAVAKALHGLQINAEIKWPNDIVIDGKKVCGILTEMSAQQDGINYIVVGIGINVHQKQFDKSIEDTAVSLDMVTDKVLKRREIIISVLDAFEMYYGIFLRYGDLSRLRVEYNRSLAHIGFEITINDGKTERYAISSGIDDEGALIAEVEGQLEHIISGEVTIRGAFGYI